MRKKAIYNFIFVRHSFLCPFAMILLMSLPWWIAFWPGTLQIDSGGQLLMYYGYVPLNDHHPILSSMLMGWAMDAGVSLFDSANMGLFIYTGIQSVTQSAVIAYGFYVMERIGGIAALVKSAILLFYMLLPVFPCWGISMVKDSGYAISFLLFTLVLIDMFYGTVKKDSLREILWILSDLGIMIFRKEGRWMLLLIIGILMIRKRAYRKFLLRGWIVAVIFLLAEGAVKIEKHVEHGTIREALSIPIMQTTAYLREYADELTQEDKKAVSDVFHADSLADIAERYDPDISDPVKSIFKAYPTKEELCRYGVVWIKGFGKHPLLYMRTIFEHCDRYFNILRDCYEKSFGWFTLIEEEEQYSNDYFEVHFLRMSRSLRSLIERCSEGMFRTPVVRVLFRPAFYTWIMLGCTGAAFLRKRYSDVLVFLPGIFVLLICIISPLNGSVRYFLPVIMAAPVYLELAFCSGKEN